MKNIITVIWLLLQAIMLSGQGAVGSWDDHLPYGRSLSLAAGGGKIGHPPAHPSLCMTYIAA